MKSRLKAVVQYVFIIGITALLIWFSLRSLKVAEGDSYADKLNYLLETWHQADKGWLIAMAVTAFISHLIRAERWRILMSSSGHATKFISPVLSVMVGYLINLVIPRGGEISRCLNLYKLEKTPVEVSFGTVVLERLIDLLCLIILLAVAFLAEYQKLLQFIDQLPIGQGESKTSLIVYLLIFLILIGFGFYLLIKRNKKLRDFFLRIWKGFKDGFLSITHLGNKKILFFIYSIAIWFLYFVMSYMVLKAFPQTSELGFSAVLSLFAIGSIAMAVPLPGGTGSYHVLVPQGLVFLYGIAQTDAVAFVFIFHGWQTAMMIVLGAMSLVITSILVKRQKAD